MNEHKTIKKILVTGSSGTIGTRLCEKLMERNFQVFGADFRPNIWNDQIQKVTIDVDLRDKKSVLELLPKDVDLIIHLAANARVYNLVVDPSLARDNFEVLFNVLEFARVNNIKKFMFSSSREVYGNSSKIVHSEDEVVLTNCESPYTSSKLAGESLIYSYEKCYGIDFVVFRFSNVYGMYDKSDRLIPLFIRLCRKGENLKVYGKEKLLDFTYVDDTVSGVILCIDKYESAKNNVYNIAYGRGTSILRVAELVKENFGVSNEIEVLENRAGEVVRYVADITKANKAVGYEPKTPIEDGIKKAIEWYKKYEV